LCRWHEGSQKAVDVSVSHWYPSTGTKPSGLLLQAARMRRAERACKALYVGVHVPVRADRCRDGVL